MRTENHISMAAHSILSPCSRKNCSDKYDVSALWVAVGHIRCRAGWRCYNPMCSCSLVQSSSLIEPMIERVLPLFYEQEELKVEVDKAWRKMVTTEYRSIISSLTVLGEDVSHYHFCHLFLSVIDISMWKWISLYLCIMTMIVWVMWQTD